MRHLLAAVATARALNARQHDLLGRLAANFLLFPLVALWAGFVLSDLWNWFVAPVLLRSISFTQAVGFLLLIFGLRVFFTSPELRGENAPTVRFKVAAAAARSIVLLFLWAVGAILNVLPV